MTGVQTCALPICWPVGSVPSAVGPPPPVSQPTVRAGAPTGAGEARPAGAGNVRPTGGAGTTPAAPRTTSPTSKAPRTTQPAPTPQRTTRAAPYLTASARASCQGGSSWTITISGTLHNASTGYFPHGFVDELGNGYPIDGHGSTRFSGTVPPGWNANHTLTASSTSWELRVYLVNDLDDSRSVSVSGTLRNPC